MARKRQSYQQKIRTREHIIADLAVNHTERQGLLCGFSRERIAHDYGLDLILFTYNSSGELEDGCIFLQVKATEQTRLLRGTQVIPFRISRADVLTWRRKIMPVILVVYDASSDIAYWLYIQRYFATLPGFDPLRLGKTITVHMPVGQTLTTVAVQQFAAFRNQILGQVGGGFHHV